MRHRTRTALALAWALAAASLALAACAPSALPGAHPATPLRVVAAENMWGSLADQLGGEKVRVTSVIANPNADPHDYEPTVADARAIAEASVVVVNGGGYDPWVARLLAANPNPNRIVIDAARVTGLPSGGNPHLWYSPEDVHTVIGEIAAAYVRLDRADASYFDAQRTQLETRDLAAYRQAIEAIVREDAAARIGCSESLIVPLAKACGLAVATPASFMNAVSEGVDPSAGDKATVDEQIRAKAIRVFVYNQQNASPDVMALVAEAKAAGIPVVTMTETLEPAGATFQEWQTRQLDELRAALAKSAGR